MVGFAGCGGMHQHKTAPVDARAEPARSEASDSGESDGIYHIILPGQTLWRIARAYGVTVDELATANGIADPSRITSGFPLFVPGATEVLDVAGYPAPLRPKSTSDWLWPVEDGAIISYFGAQRRNHRHAGIDIRGERRQQVRAARGGRVVYSGATMRGYGKTIVIDHGDGFHSLYAHNDKLLVSVGQRIERGEAIALVGMTGNATVEHCHFEIRRGDLPVDPLIFLQPLEARR
jgi:murein DD-endopeptidase MepM/ murein hydrolase activator NlpD